MGCVCRRVCTEQVIINLLSMWKTNLANYNVLPGGPTLSMTVRLAINFDFVDVVSELVILTSCLESCTDW